MAQMPCCAQNTQASYQDVALPGAHSAWQAPSLGSPPSEQRNREIPIRLQVLPAQQPHQADGG